MFDLGSVVAHVKADITDFQQGMSKVQKDLTGLGQGLQAVGTQAAIFTGIVGAGVVLALKDASNEAAQFEKAMTTLDIIAGRFGVSAKDAKKAAKELGTELRIGTGSAAESLQNLFKSGLNLEQATDLLRRFTNEAITGKSPQISLAQAVQNLSFAYTTQNSALGNMSGVSENFQDIIEKGRDALIAEGKAASEVTDEMAKYRGMIDLTNLTMGSSERFQGSFIDKQAEMAAKVLELKIAIGQALNPVLAVFLGLISDSGLIESVQKFTADIAPPLIAAFTAFGEWIKNNQESVLSFIKALAVAIGSLLVIGSVTIAIAAMTNPLVQLGAAITALYFIWETNMFGIRDLTDEATTSIINTFNNRLKPAIENITKAFKDNGGDWQMIVRSVLETIVGIFQISTAAIGTIMNIFLDILAGRWDQIPKTAMDGAQSMKDGVGKIFQGMVDMLAGFGVKITDNITAPFRNAWNAVQDIMNKIANAADMTKRHSPSIVDRIETGVAAANRAFEGLQMPNIVTPNVGVGAIAPSGAAGVSSGAIINQTNMIYDQIDMDAAMGDISFALKVQ